MHNSSSERLLELLDLSLLPPLVPLELHMPRRRLSKLSKPLTTLKRSLPEAQLSLELDSSE